ncbi:chorismate-binding protein [Elizabethkingia meningoseptica]|uniref:chorismate-binding protein n=1 Tax=Elizabethkingia meningoseptica TaxID=238 RepID=UPI0023AF7B5E|nr:chorismate-binding protein [Elizabethkingia meningoseptica]MDE5430635.1 chorismate-binding protein [Elizabethkingia meningoseptica]
MQTLIFKFPFQEEFYTLNDQTNHQNTVWFHSFDNLRETIFKGSIEPISEEEIIRINITSKDIQQQYKSQPETKEEYLSGLEEVIDIIKEHNLPKVVISRQKWVGFKDHETADLGKTFLKLCHDYPNAFIHLFVNDQDAWIGATPEVLGKYNKATGLFETMSLAGTLPVAEEWSEKEIEEQKPVSTYIRSILTQFSDQLESSPVYDHISGNIKHLRNDFKAIVQEKDIPGIIKELHPTPAVCGVPKEQCFNIIKSIESHDRKFYAGYIRIEQAQEINYYVNLRCAQLFCNGILLYAGGGITALSQPEKEWKETELKGDAVLQRLSLFNT